MGATQQMPMTETSVSFDTLRTLKEMVIEVAQLRIPAEEIRNTANLFNDCGVDSASVVDLVLALEEKFGITIDEDELDVNLFQDLSQLGAFIESKLALTT